MALGKFSSLKLKALVIAGFLLPAFGTYAEESASDTFTNPIYENGADPWLEYFDGNYYLTTTTWTSQLVMRKSPTLAGLADAEPVYLWSETSAERCCNFWAYEFHRLEGPDGYRWYMMFTSGRQEDLGGQHLTVLESAGDDPMGPYTLKGSPMPDSWNIDGNYLQYDDKLYLLWSEWVNAGQEDEAQLNWIAEMENPWTITGERKVLTRPEYDWERSGRPVTEGAETLQKDGRTFVIYSASYCDTPDYKLGLIELTGSDPLNPDHWEKNPEPVFERGNGVYGPGHNGFFSSPDGTEDWIIYHGNSKETDGCSATRSLRAQPFTWNDDGTPNFGEPVSAGEPIKVPSGEDGPFKVTPQGTSFVIRNAADNQCLADADSTAECTNENQWVIDPVGHGEFRLANAEGEFLTAAKCGTDNSAWENKSCQKWQVSTDDNGYLSFTNLESDETLQGQWQLSTNEPVVMQSRQSGKVASLKNNTLVQQNWMNETSQHWHIRNAEHGFVNLVNTANEKCLAIENNSLAAGATVTTGECASDAGQWKLQLHSSGAMEVISRHSGLTLDLASCGLKEGMSINQAPANDTLCQHFFIRQVQ
ncbi:GH43 family beta-xylosidase [Idiomarina loihiensis]|uniref:family 43 glycosylhydrolase n=1 Tax=Idiomarina TaxID=135575 RepID=UPI000D70B43A|nr:MULTISPECIES: family 43 glycosylhydrolase [Idiomarina]PWW34526.1 GH43 family beta-xylosidase [Idiomarina loihiensis]TDP47656.1 GH43 family beta-xylosidase [Idiomarina loihiensis]TDS23397.1 GH43 family beta-xylosidase [Idiomarina sp. H2]